jgi:hypothetical protein
MKKSAKKVEELLFELSSIEEFQRNFTLAFQIEWGEKLGSMRIKKEFISEKRCEHARRGWFWARDENKAGTCPESHIMRASAIYYEGKQRSHMTVERSPEAYGRGPISIGPLVGSIPKNSHRKSYRSSDLKRCYYKKRTNNANKVEETTVNHMYLRGEIIHAFCKH